MKIFSTPEITAPENCQYLFDRKSVTQYFYAADLNEAELEEFLCRGWRKFGCYFFRPVCEDCSECIPLRVPVNSFVLSKSQRRVMRKNSDISVMFDSDTRITDEIYEIYKEHSKIRFNRETDRTDFENGFGYNSCPSLLSKYYMNDKLCAVGFLDRSVVSLSSVYFIYNRDFVCRSPGTFSILQEIEYTRKLGLLYYYLGYYIRENSHMAYKAKFFPNERMCRDSGLWQNVSNDK